MPVRRSKLTCTTAQTLRSSAPVTRPDKPSCSWPSAAQRARFICSSVARWGPECPNTWRNGFGQPPMWWSTNRPRSTPLIGDRRLEEITLKSHADTEQRRLPLLSRFRIHRGRTVRGWLPLRHWPRCQGLPVDRRRRRRDRDCGHAPIASPVPWRRLFRGCWPLGISAPAPRNESVSRSATAPWPLPAPIAGFDSALNCDLPMSKGFWFTWTGGPSWRPRLTSFRSAHVAAMFAASNRNSAH